MRTENMPASTLKKTSAAAASIGRLTDSMRRLSMRAARRTGGPQRTEAAGCIICRKINCWRPAP